jgi:hypothetical protein
MKIDLGFRFLILDYLRSSFKKPSRYAWVIILCSIYYQITVFQPWRHQTWNNLGQFTNGCLFRITRTLHTDDVWHTPALVFSQCVGVLKRLSGGTLRQTGLLCRATAWNSCRKTISRQHPIPQGSRTVGYSVFVSFLFLMDSSLLEIEYQQQKCSTINIFKYYNA